MNLVPFWHLQCSYTNFPNKMNDLEKQKKKTCFGDEKFCRKRKHFSRFRNVFFQFCRTPLFICMYPDFGQAPLVSEFLKNATFHGKFLKLWTNPSEKPSFFGKKTLLIVANILQHLFSSRSMRPVNYETIFHLVGPQNLHGLP